MVCAFATQMSAEEVAWVNDWGRDGEGVCFGGCGGEKSCREDFVTCDWYWQCIM